MNRLTKQMIGFAAGALLLAGCQAGAQSDNGVAVMGTSQERSMIQVEGEKIISLEEAKEIAFEHAGVDGNNARFDDEEYDEDDRKYELEFKVDNVEYEYDIDAFTGEILEAEKDVKRSKEKKAETVNATKSDFIGMDNAIEIALTDAGFKANEVKWDDQEFDKSDRLYELEFKAGEFEFEYDINALTGEIVKREKDNDDDHKPKVKEESTSKETKNESSKETTKEQAIEIALNHAGVSRSDVRFDEIDLDSDDGVRYWEIDFDAGNYEYEYDIQVSNGTILDVEREKSDDYKEKTQAKVQEKKTTEKKSSKELTKDQAIEVALKHAGLSRSDVKFDDVELDSDDGVSYWEIEFDHGQKEYEYDIHAGTGNILDFEVELDD